MVTVEEILAGIPALVGFRATKSLAGGMASDKWLLQSSKEKLVLRVDRPLACTLGLDRDAELQLLHTLSVSGIVPPVFWSDVAKGLLVTRYVSGSPWGASDFHDPENLCNLAALLWRLHQIPPQGKALDLEAKFRHYASKLPTHSTNDLQEEALAALTAANELSAVRAVCHNDPVCGNVIEGDSLALIDWEYSAVGAPLFDLAVVAEHHRLSDSEVEGFTSAYGSGLTRQQRKELDGWRTVYGLLAEMWQLVAASNTGNMGEGSK